MHLSDLNSFPLSIDDLASSLDSDEAFRTSQDVVEGRKRQERMLDQISGMYSGLFGSKSGPHR